MTIDLHTRLWTSTEQFGPSVAAQMRRRKIDAWEDHTADPDEHHDAMTPVAAAVLLGFESKLLGGSISHQQIADYIKRDPDRLFGFAGIDPKSDTPPTQSLEQAIGLGLSGVTVNPAAAGFHPTDTRAMSLFEACQHHRLPVLIECGTVLAREARMEFARPVLLDEVIREFPDLNIVLGTFGDPWVEEGVALLAKHPNVYADLSGFTARPWQLFNALLTAHQQGTMNQVLFGSNFPFVSPEQAIKTIYSVNTLTQGTQLPSVPREQLRSVVERDTIELLGLKRESAKPAKPDAVETDTDQPAASEREATS
ncbi:MAG: amidohydrolase family protein [Phycisphaeraceae bacterium]